eukprot:CAMPEP_0113559436 /NCGR_PEP_ID=MMETSP0015_2-20120614/18897_1 /TAXON_ID=2838 /ORGANISM="Odontella" /LENGTH=70 /DNA_ID=CAMNT_0000461075 /DNA_START=139 /DNA_END=351 /DNA_ORIENTATION=+ /assembly_acc=CAM_ASM_000160
MSSNLHYPNLANCSVSLSPALTDGRTPITLSKECAEAAETPIPEVYDFSIERSVMKKKEEQQKKDGGAKK